MNRIVYCLTMMASQTLAIQAVASSENSIFVGDTAIEADTELNLVVEGIDVSRPGSIMVMLFAQSGFPKEHDKALDTQILPVEHSKLSFSFTKVPSEFAIKVLHDEDNSQKVTKNWTQIIPAEGLGFSNGAKLGFGPPSFKQAKLKKNQQLGTISIRIIYP
ncbi:DUF2141 domain-containing protein [Litorilituus sediminis]|nr:DUF2141 domain-containing protein [Litorilituus sediminis]